jgi:hypothetical protein
MDRTEIANGQWVGQTVSTKEQIDIGLIPGMEAFTE